MPGPLDQLSPAARDARRRARAAERMRATAFGPDHPAIVVAVRWMEMQASASTVAASMSDLLPFLAFCDANGIEPLELRRPEARLYVATQSRLALAPSSVARRVSTCRSFYSALEEEGLVAANPFYRVKGGGREPVVATPALTYEQVNRLIEMAGSRTRNGRGTLHDHRNAAMAYVMVRVGPRCKEVSEARWGDLGARGDAVEWRIHGKGNRWSPVILPPDVLEVLDDWQEALEAAIRRPVRQADPIFAALDSVGVDHVIGRRRAEALRPLATRQISRIFSGLLHDVGLTGPRYAAHAARATAATLAYIATRDVVAVQRLLRHRNQATTIGYIKHATTETPAAEWRPAAHPPMRRRTVAEQGTDAA